MDRKAVDELARRIVKILVSISFGSALGAQMLANNRQPTVLEASGLAVAVVVAYVIYRVSGHAVQREIGILTYYICIGALLFSGLRKWGLL